MARKRKLFGNYEAPSQENFSQQSSGNKFLVIKDEFKEMLWNEMKGNGKAVIDVIPYQVEFPAGVSVDINPKAKQKDKIFDNNGCYINKSKGDWVYQLNFWVHENIGPEKKTIVCPRTFGERCPVCDKEQNILSNWPCEAGSDESKEFYRKNIAPFKTKNRTLYNIRWKDKEGNVKQMLWNASWFFVPSAILGINKDPRTEEPIFWFDPDDGKSIYFEWMNFDKSETKPEVKGVQFIDRDEVITDEQIDAAIPLETVLVHSTYEEIQEMMEGKVNPVYENEAEESEDTDKQLDDAFGKADDEELPPPFDVDEEEEEVEEKITMVDIEETLSRATKRDIAKIKSYDDIDDLDKFCEERDFEIYPDDYDNDLDKFKQACIEYVKQNG